MARSLSTTYLELVEWRSTEVDRLMHVKADDRHHNQGNADSVSVASDESHCRSLSRCLVTSG